jgi:hypothetical protein
MKRVKTGELQNKSKTLDMRKQVVYHENIFIVLGYY